MGEVRAETVIAEVDALSGRPCRDCGARTHALEAAVGVFLGSKGAARCLDCLARLFQREPAELARSAAEQISRLACYRAGWDHARSRLIAAGAWPPERFPPGLRVGSPGAAAPAPARAAAESVTTWDAGSMSCGDLVLELRLRLRELPAGACLRVLASDPGAPGDIPAWCRVTGHELVAQSHPEYLIRRSGTAAPNPRAPESR